ncbi:MAG: cytochrome c3 family protein [Candidatus Krumholzibacteria bacterium]|nr:cytochrome c3 family protein [Candidatus Krumholzibacteria bacterium]
MKNKRIADLLHNVGTISSFCGPLAFWLFGACLLVLAFCLAFSSQVLAQPAFSPHLDPDHGVRRISTPETPTGSCGQCHDLHALETGDSPYPKALFADNSNMLCFTQGGVGPCHQAMPSNYPALETSRIPEGFSDAGYFEYNGGGQTIHGVNFRDRWPGAVVYDYPGMVRGLGYYSPHRNDPDMPRKDIAGVGSCLNCHNPHGSENPFDMLVSPYRGIGGFDEPTYPTRYQLCFDCHAVFGPIGMESSGRLIQDFYDSSINGESAGHQIRLNPDIAISWPSHIRAGDKLPCYDCHNPHGSRGYNGEGPNAYLISDQRIGWSNLTNTKRDPLQNRRFCLGCHIPSDGVPGSQVVEGIVMNTLPVESGHETTYINGCFECHGSDYFSSTANNVHNPGG